LCDAGEIFAATARRRRITLMRTSIFFDEEQDPAWDFNGDPWSSFHTVFNSDLVEQFRHGSVADYPDLEVAYAMAQLAHAELGSYGTDGKEELDDEQLSVLLRSLRAVLLRLGVQWNPPFRNFSQFRGYWSANGMSGAGGWGARRGYLNELFNPVFEELDRLENISSGITAIRGVDGEMKNIIFASTGAKPRIVFRDAINNVIDVTENGEYCLFYNRPLTEAGLSWGELIDWWRTENNLGHLSDEDLKRDLYRRLMASLGGNEAERLVFASYYSRFQDRDAAQQPALLPQVYLHFDPLTRKERGGGPGPLPRERMDFLLLLPGGVRVVLEVDGKQHYAEGDVASPRLYSEMVAEDRALRLKGYDVYRFGGSELGRTDAATMLVKFFDDLEERYGIR
jgi:hypothetical protein